MPRSIANLIGRQLPLHDLLAQPGDLVTMVATSKAGWLCGPVPDENGCGTIERFLNRSPGLLPMRGFGTQTIDATSPIGLQGEQVDNLGVTVAKELGRLPDPAESPGSGCRRGIGENADEHTASRHCGPEAFPPEARSGWDMRARTMSAGRMLRSRSHASS